MEIWWIAVFCVLKAQALLPHAERLSSWDRNIANALAIALPLAALLLIALTEVGRWSAFVVLGIAVCGQAVEMLPPGQHWTAQLSHLIVLGFCLWMMVYLQSESTRSLCGRDAKQRFGVWPIGRFSSMGFFEPLCGVAAGLIAHAVGADMLRAASIGLSSAIAYDTLLDGWVRKHLVTLLSPAYAKLNPAAKSCWRAAGQALQRGDYRQARDHVETVGARMFPEGELFVCVLNWRELLAADPADGIACLKRLAFDHDWKPSEVERKRLLGYVECASDEIFYTVVEERAKLIDGLVEAAHDPRSFYYSEADAFLARVTGETFGFNTPESWKAWWKKTEPDWRGDAGMVSLVARMLRLDGEAANMLARRIAGRAEEPMLRELAGQMLYLNELQKAMKEQTGVEPFIRQPQRMLLVPDLTDAVGLLYVDSQVLENLGLPLNAVARRLNVRVQLIDYIASLWKRYPNELSSDMPWLLKTLTGKNFGVLMARAKFERWWPKSRESMLRHDRAVAAGLNAHANEDDAGEEQAFREALREQPRSLSARYNLALCAMKRQKHGEAARLLQELIDLEPKEPFWWIVLGVMHRNRNKSADAHAAFRRALELGAAAPRVAWHVGVTLAKDQRDAEAIKQLDRALGQNPPASRIEAFVSLLESEGLWHLAGHYREEAFRRGLASGGEEDPNGGDLAA
jgi:hypothetical protein